MATDMEQQAEPEMLKPSSGTDALWEMVLVSEVLGGAEKSFSASALAGRWGETGAEVVFSSSLCNILKVTGTDMHLGQC